MEDAKIARDDAKKAYENSNKDENNILGFFEWLETVKPELNSEISIARGYLLEYPDNIDYSNPEDAASIKKIKKSLDFMEEGNQLRINDENFPGLDSLFVTHEMLAIAISNADNSLYYKTGHLKHFKVGENLAWGYKDPYDGWYYKEKDIYNKNSNSLKAGHYVNMLRDHYTITGLGVNSKRTNGLRTVFSQVFSWADGETSYTIAEYKDLLSQYEAFIKSNPLRIEYETAENNYNALNKQLSEAKTKNNNKDSKNNKKNKNNKDNNNTKNNNNTEDNKNNKNNNKNYNKSHIDEIKAKVKILTGKRNALVFIKENLPELARRYQKLIDDAIVSVEKALKQANIYLETYNK